MKVIILLACIGMAFGEMVVKGYGTPMAYACDFSEDMCDFYGNTTQMDWNIAQTKDAKPNRYLKTEAKDTLDTNKYVLSNCYSVTSPKLCLQFKYTVTGSDDVKLTVRQKGGDKYQVWESKKGSVNNGWSMIHINVSLLPLQKKVQFLFKASLGGKTGNSVGIDDISLVPYEC